MKNLNKFLDNLSNFFIHSTELREIKGGYGGGEDVPSCEAVCRSPKAPLKKSCSGCIARDADSPGNEDSDGFVVCDHGTGALYNC